MTRILEVWLSGAPWTWFVLAIALLILELFTGTTYLLWIAVASAATGVILLGFDVAWQAQLGLFAVLTFAVAIAGRRFLRPGWLRSDQPDLNEGLARVAGRTAFAVADFAAGVGRVKLDDTVWGARAADGEPIRAGEALTVTGMEGSTLQVRRAP